MRRMIFAILAVAAVAVAAPNTYGVWAESTAHHIRTGYHRNEAWPWPFVCPDRLAVREPFAKMVSNGWRRQNLLGQHHFDPEKNTLNTAGELKVQWIMTQAPQDRRSIFVARSLDSDVTAQRVEAAREYAQQVAVEGVTPQVSDTHLMPEGRPAATVDTIYVKWHENMQAPVLPAPSASSAFTQ